VVRDHEGGTCGEGGSLDAEAGPRGSAGVDSGGHVDEGDTSDGDSVRENRSTVTNPKRGRSVPPTRAMQEL
jgi:hypothetical protein